MLSDVFLLFKCSTTVRSGPNPHECAKYDVKHGVVESEEFFPPPIHYYWAGSKQYCLDICSRRIQELLAIQRIGIYQAIRFLNVF